ncbi:N-terminal nucleophile aminohydrolase [Dissoconium aciculare CBS 342.82]|uniref:N-terminal nucleophile aminohydrolase n=1 Tax=Dissoconium aciculare CBS 342.82 TaxID=1314786 RepID=A0A6J3MFB8_9PEZI|nr:N-terminal nucleophile aminohydrolase [Dissoconium aciculare CBS 342.82]KAF1826538.1 N-terminal nucleophile aminohydrolase [Dissoconium aciculare CBS 342.82]
MCGIFCSVSRHEFTAPSPNLRTLLESRGPDASNVIEKVSQPTSASLSPVWLTFHSTVLSLRTEIVVDQPYSAGASGSVLCWNGEAWAFRHVPIKDSDTSAIYTHLDQALDISQETDACGMLEMVALTMAQIAGPFAFVYYDDRSDRIFMGRDFLGRRSLVRCMD